jgi:hypothetical protein
VLSSQPVYYLSALIAPAETIEDIDRRRKRFLWTGTDQIAGGKCKVAWPKACRPTRLRGLGILDLKKFARALRLRWLWQEWKSPGKPWVGMPIPCTEEDRRLFNSATTITVGNGEEMGNWQDSGILLGCKDSHRNRSRHPSMLSPKREGELLPTLHSTTRGSSTLTFRAYVLHHKFMSLAFFGSA